MLLDLARNEGPDVVHLPYTAEFEAVCQRLKPAATIEDKHRIWEKLLGLTEKEPSPVEAAISTQVAPVNAACFDPLRTCVFINHLARAVRAAVQDTLF